MNENSSCPKIVKTPFSPWEDSTKQKMENNKFIQPHWYTHASPSLTTFPLPSLLENILDPFFSFSKWWILQVDAMVLGLVKGFLF